MAKNAQNKTEEDLSLGYQTTLQLIIYEGGLVWTRFNTMLTAHLVLFGIIGLVLTANDKVSNSSFFLITLTCAGIIVSFLWFIMTTRSFTYLQYLTLSAREYEDKIGSEDLKTLRRGYDFIQNKTVHFTFSDPKPSSKYSRPWYAKLLGSMRMEIAAYWVIIVIGIIYVILFIGVLTGFLIDKPQKNYNLYHSRSHIKQNLEFKNYRNIRGETNFIY